MDERLGLGERNGNGHGTGDDEDGEKDQESSSGQGRDRILRAHRFRPTRRRIGTLGAPHARFSRVRSTRGNH
jgi:hypothetical protein